MQKRIAHGFLIAILAAVLCSCSDADPSNTYRNNGFSVTTLDNWSFSKDTNDSLFGDREVIFSLSDFSFAAFYIRKKENDFSSFVDFYLQKSLPSISQPDTKLERSEVKIANYDAVIAKVTSKFIGEEEVSILYAVNVPKEKRNVYFMSLVTPEDNFATNNELESIIKSIELKY